MHSPLRATGAGIAQCARPSFNGFAQVTLRTSILEVKRPFMSSTPSASVAAPTRMHEVPPHPPPPRVTPGAKEID